MSWHWTETNPQLVDTEEKRDAILVEFGRLEWHDLPVADAPMMQGEALKAIIDSLCYRPLAVAWGIILGHGDLLGIRFKHAGGIGVALWVDVGTKILYLASRGDVPCVD